ncbi:MAG: hypothetical protein OEZ47_08980 [Gammaproteobacteria bacterium]|nr:hypothetical protein [Gammaproteobacteria bacterium]
MNEKIKQILAQINHLEDELLESVKKQQEKFYYQIDGKRIKFEKEIQDAHKKVRTGIIRWFTKVQPQNYLTAPLIYGLFIPLLVIDISVTIYQSICFPIYRIKKAKRSNYFLYDHSQLAYLNVIERFHCVYCSYANGVFAYGRDVAARTEQYFCPIKHAHKITEAHSRYHRYIDYGDTENLEHRLQGFRNELKEELENVNVSETTKDN